MNDRAYTNGESSTHFWWINHVDRRFYTILAYEHDAGSQGKSVMDDFGNLVLV